MRSHFPVPSVREPWSEVVVSFYEQLSTHPLMWVDGQGGRWLPPAQVSPSPCPALPPPPASDARVMRGSSLCATQRPRVHNCTRT